MIFILYTLYTLHFETHDSSFFTMFSLDKTFFKMSATKVNYYNLLVILIAAIGSFTFGFTVNASGSVLGMASFYNYFQLDIPSTTG